MSKRSVDQGLTAMLRGLGRGECVTVNWPIRSVAPRASVIFGAGKYTCCSVDDGAATIVTRLKRARPVRKTGPRGK